MNAHRTRSRVCAMLAVAALVGATPIASGATPASTEERAAAIALKPATLERGDDPKTPQLLGTTILDGDVRIEIAAQEVQLLGKSGDDYVVGVWKRDGDDRVQRIAVDGARQTVMDDIRGDLLLSCDGRRVIETVVRAAAKSIVTVRDASDGERVARRVFHGYVRVLDADRGRAILGATSPDRTFWWSFPRDRVDKIAGREGYFADIGADRIAMLTGNPYEGGCSVLASLSAAHQTLWRSCRQAVVAASPSGRRLLTEHILMDGPVAKVSVHGAHGRLLAAYRSAGWFGRVSWETNRSALLQTYGSKKTAIVRCEGVVCERASTRIETPPH